MMHRSGILLLVLASATLAQAQTPAPSGISAQEIVSKWRAAVYAGKWQQPRTALLTSTSNEGEIPGKVEEWVTTGGDYRAVVAREFDEAEVVLSRHSTQRHDWNGFVREVQGQELKLTSRTRRGSMGRGTRRAMPPALTSVVFTVRSKGGLCSECRWTSNSTGRRK
jgi:hypothetical protein